MKIKDLPGQIVIKEVEGSVKKKTRRKTKKKIPEVCSNLRKLRKQAGLTQQQVADNLGYARSYISLLETGRETPNRRQVSLFSRFYKVSVLEINPEFEIVDDSLTFH